MKTKQIIITTTINADIKMSVADALRESLAENIIGSIASIQDDKNVIKSMTIETEIKKL